MTKCEALNRGIKLCGGLRNSRSRYYCNQGVEQRTEDPFSSRKSAKSDVFERVSEIDLHLRAACMPSKYLNSCKNFGIPASESSVTCSPSKIEVLYLQRKSENSSLTILSAERPEMMASSDNFRSSSR